VPVWHAATKELRKNGDLVVIGIIQEQHPDRCRLYAQWQQFDWPILHDPINQLDLRGVPIAIAIDEQGIVRDTRPRSSNIEAFVARNFEATRDTSPAASPAVPNIESLANKAKKEKSSEAWRNLGDAQILWGDSQELNNVVSDYQEAVRLNPKDAAAHFRLGVAHRMRHESPLREPDDFEVAIQQWGKALEINPNHYIFRRRIQQYGPRLTKPYPFYDWVNLAVSEVQSRGEKPIQLSVPPSGAEIAQPSRHFQPSLENSVSPDPKGKINRDTQSLIEIKSVLVPAKIRPGDAARIHLSLRPAMNAHWNNEVEPVQIWIDSPNGWTIEKRLHSAKQPAAPESREERNVEFEIRAPQEANGTMRLNGYALYYVCEDAGGKCLYLRQDFSVEIGLME